MRELEGPEDRRGSWLETLLDRAERVHPFWFNLALLVGIIVASTLLSVGLWRLSIAWIGWTVPDGSSLLVVLIAATVSFTVAAPTVFLGFALISRVHAITERLRQALEAADLANRSKTEFLANMSHEVRTPLNAVLGMTRVLEESRLDDDQRAALRVIHDSGDVLLAIISEVLDLSKIDTGHITLEATPQELVPVVSSCVDLFRARAVERDNTLTLVVDPGTPRLAKFDSVRVRQCLANLISNAVKFTKAGEIVVTLSVQALPGQWLVRASVRDTGIGIASEDLPRLFKPFQQVGSGAMRMHNGTGLGLAIAQRLATAMGGSVTVRSAPGQGSDFVLTFKAEVMEGEMSPREPVRTGRGEDLAGLRALVVDDTATNRMVVQAMLRARGAKCLEAESGKACLELMGREPIDLVLLDIRMPEMDGFEVLRAIRALRGAASGIPVIALTADVLSASAEEYLARGFTGFLGKPLDIELLSAAVRSAVPR